MVLHLAGLMWASFVLALVMAFVARVLGASA